MKKLMILAAVAAMTVAAEAKFGTIGLPVDQDYFVGRDTTPVLIKGIDVWSTKADAQVKVSRVRSVDAYTNAYEVTCWIETNLVKVVDVYEYSYKCGKYGSSEKITLANTNFTDTVVNNNQYSSLELKNKDIEFPYINMAGVGFGGVLQYALCFSEDEYDNNPRRIGGSAVPTTLQFQHPTTHDVWGANLQKKELSWHYVTNMIPHYVTNRTWRVKSGSNYSTNLIVNATCQNGFISYVMTNDMYLVYGDLVHTEGLTDTAGTATAATIIYQE